MKTTFLAMLSAIAVLAAPCATWADEPNPGYLGASLGTGLAEACQDDLLPRSRPSCQDLATLRIFGGYHFNRNFAIEGAVLTSEREEGAAAELTAVGVAPLDKHFALYGKLGGFVGGTQTGLTFGAGVRLHLGETFGVRAEWQRYKASNSGDLVSLGVFFRF